MNLSRENEETLSIDFEGVMVPLYDFVQAVVVVNYFADFVMMRTKSQSTYTSPLVWP